MKSKAVFMAALLYICHISNRVNAIIMTLIDVKCKVINMNVTQEVFGCVGVCRRYEAVSLNWDTFHEVRSGLLQVL